MDECGLMPPIIRRIGVTKNNTKTSIVNVADRLFYEQGFEHTSFADVAKEVGISRGNFYYHFTTKDQILEAVIERRIENRQAMLTQWECEFHTPQQRVLAFIRILLVNEAKIRKYGCPVGTLSIEMSKLSHTGEAGARRIFDVFRVWLTRQFTEIGRAGDADELAMHILARSQGAATLATTYPTEDFLEREVQQMTAWLEAICASSKS